MHCKPSGPRYTRECVTDGCRAYHSSSHKILGDYKCRKCAEGFVGMTRAELEGIVSRATKAIEKLPVEVDPVELAQLRERDALLLGIERLVQPHLAAHRDLSAPNAEALALLDWLQRTNVLRGQRL